MAENPIIGENVHLHAEAVLKVGVDIGLPAPIVMEIPLAGLDGAMNLDEFQDVMEMALDAKTMVQRWRKEMIANYPGPLLSAIVLELTGFVQIARAAMAESELSEAVSK